jgi:type I restriction enzyme M protein
MAIKKSELYSTLWSSCDALRGSMDASQYKDYVLVLLFIKYISDKYAGEPFAPITIPKGATFADMVKLKGNPEIGDLINKKIITPLKDANKLSNMPDFNDEAKLGKDKEKVDKLTDLIAIFENKNLDFKNNRATGDDLLGDAYEYLMRHFATESGKSKGQFYTPSEVSRIMAKIIGINSAATTNQTTVYDPTCGSGSLLLKVGDEADAQVTLYGQEKDSATSALARMNMILHNHPEAQIELGNTLAGPLFKTDNELKTFDFVVANPPFSDKRWSQGLKPSEDPYMRFEGFGIPPEKQGDYAYLLHIVRSLKSSGKGACILPHGVLFRGNAEEEIRKNLIKKGYIKGIIGLPANLFYGTGIPACIIVIDKENAAKRKGIFMIDASNGFKKDGPKNRLREMDIHYIVDTFTHQIEMAGYSRMVPVKEIEDNDYNLNIPRYIDSTAEEEAQDITAHLKGGIPEADIERLDSYWQILPELKDELFKQVRKGYLALRISDDRIKSTILENSQFVDFNKKMSSHYNKWMKQQSEKLSSLETGFQPKHLIHELSESLLDHYRKKPLIHHYDVYQHLMDYWDETMQDDCYIISADGWKAETYRITEKDKNGKEKDKGWTCDLIPKEYIVDYFFKDEKKTLQNKENQLESVTAESEQLVEENSGEEDCFADIDKISKASVGAKLKELKEDADSKEACLILEKWLENNERESQLKKEVKELTANLDDLAYKKYAELTRDEIIDIVVNHKWLIKISEAVEGEIDRVSQTLSSRIKELAERYDKPLPELEKTVQELEKCVAAHLAKMGYAL